MRRKLLLLPLYENTQYSPFYTIEAYKSPMLVYYKQQFANSKRIKCKSPCTIIWYYFRDKGTTEADNNLHKNQLNLISAKRIIYRFIEIVKFNLS